MLGFSINKLEENTITKIRNCCETRKIHLTTVSLGIADKFGQLEQKFQKSVIPRLIQDLISKSVKPREFTYRRF